MLLNRKNISNQTDEALILLYKQKQHQSILAELYKRYNQLVYGVCLKYLENVPDAQDTLMNIFEKLPNDLLKHQITTFKAWLYTKTKNECFMLLRKTKKQFIDNSDNLEVKDDGLDDILIKQEKESIYQGVIKALDQLNNIQKECVVRFYLNGNTYKEIQETCGYSLKEIKSAIQNGKRNLRNILSYETTKEE